MQIPSLFSSQPTPRSDHLHLDQPRLVLIKSYTQDRQANPVEVHLQLDPKHESYHHIRQIIDLTDHHYLNHIRRYHPEYHHRYYTVHIY